MKSPTKPACTACDARPMSRARSLALSRRSVLAALAAGACAAPPARAQARPLRIVVPFTPGGTSDILARALAPKLGAALGETVIVENRPGAGGSVAAAEVARAEPDGRTLFMGHVGTLAVNPAMFAKLPYDPVKDFVPITLLAKVPSLLVVNAEKMKAKNLKELVALSLRLADIYQDKLKDAGKALTHYTKVLQLQPQNQLALGKVAELFMQQNKPAGALPILRRLVKYTDEKPKKIAFYHRIAALSELAGDNRGALEALRQAVDVDPMHMPSLGELAKFYDRQKDSQSMRILLDRTATRFRPLLREKPRDASVLQTLLQIFLWKKSRDHAAVTASTLTTLGNPVPAELKAELDKLPPKKDATRDGMRDLNIDDVLYPTRLAPGFRALLRMLAEPLAKLYPADSKKLAAMGVDKKERLPKSGHPVRDLANKIAADLNVGEFDIYVTAAKRKEEDGKQSPLCTIEPADPPALVISNTLLEGSEAEKRFLLSGLLMLLRSNLVLPLSLNPDEVGLLIGALVRQFVPNYTPLGYAEKRIANEAARLKKAIPSKLHGQLLPHAMECSAESLDFEGIADTLRQCAYHIGLVLTVDMNSAIAAIRRRGPGAERDVDDLIRFAVSDEFAELRRIVTGA